MDRYSRSTFQILQGAAIGILYSIATLCVAAQAGGHTLSFTDVALEAGFQDRLGHGRAIAAADFDGNGWDDYFLGNPTDESFILWNDGPDKFGKFRLRKGQIIFTREVAFVASAADYDNDGDPDLYVGVGGQEGVGLDYLFRNDNGIFTDVSEMAGIKGPINPDTGEWVPVATSSGTWADYDKDGDLDLFVAARIIREQEFFPGQRPLSLILPDNLGWRDTLFRNNGNGTFTDVTEQSGIRGIKSSMTASWGDYDNDGWVDLVIPYSDYEALVFVREDNGYMLYKNNQDGTFIEAPLDMYALGEKDPVLWASAAADFNNDGLLDILGFGKNGFRTPSDSHTLLINQGNLTFSSEAVSSGLVTPGELPPRVMGCQVGDVDSNGYPDVIMANGWPSSGTVDKLFLNFYNEQNGIRFSDVSSTIDYPALDDPNCTSPHECYPPYPYRGHAVVILDYDKDGKMDIAMSKGGMGVDLEGVSSAEPNRLFRNDGINTGNGLFLELHGRVSNRDAVGARIEVTVEEDDKSRKIYKEIKGGSCFSASGPREVHIGLGEADEIEQLKITWPSGIQTVLHDVDINQRIKTYESTLYNNDFNTGSTPGWKPLSGVWTVSNGQYIQSGAGTAIALHAQKERAEDYSVVGKLTYLSGAKQAGLLGRVSRDGKHYYAGILQNNQARLYKSINGNMLPIGEPIPIDTMTPGKSYIMRLTFDDDSILLVVDGEETKVTDHTIKSGAIGLYTKDMVMAVDNVAVYAMIDEDKGEDEE